MLRLIGQFTPVLALYDPFGVDVALNFNITHSHYTMTDMARQPQLTATRILVYSWSMLIQTYRLNASERHLPICCIFFSGTPDRAASMGRSTYLKTVASDVCLVDTHTLQGSLETAGKERLRNW